MNETDSTINGIIKKCICHYIVSGLCPASKLNIAVLQTMLLASLELTEY